VQWPSAVIGRPLIHDSNGTGVSMKTRRMIGMLMMAGAFLLAGPVRAQNAMEEAMQKAATPGPQHQFLASPDPVSKKDMTFRSVTTYDTPDHYTSVFYMVMPNGSEMKNMEMIGRRVK